jgi:Ser/Thr protein kinase RdoA (MazF antagonist)
LLRKSVESDMEDTVRSAVDQTLHTKVLSVSKIDKGEFNKVFKVETQDKIIIARVFRHSHWPEEGKVQWIEEALLKNNIPHAKVLHYSRDNQYFDNGFMLTEYIEGQNGSDAIVNGNISFEEFHEKLAYVLSLINQIPIKQYGLINNGEGEYKTLVEYKFKQLTKDLEKLSQVNDFDQSFLPKTENKIRETLTKFESRLHPVLVHADATPVNSIYTNEGQVILIDWDGALAESWIRDYSWMTYSGSHLSQLGTREERQEKIRQAFAKAYKQNEFDKDELSELELAYHAMRAIELLPYYYFDQKNIDAFEKTRVRLADLLEKL